MPSLGPDLAPTELSIQVGALAQHVLAAGQIKGLTDKGAALFQIILQGSVIGAVFKIVMRHLTAAGQSRICAFGPTMNEIGRPDQRLPSFQQAAFRFQAMFVDQLANADLIVGIGLSPANLCAGENR